MLQERHFIHHRQGFAQAVVHQHAVVLFEDRRHHVDPAVDRLIEPPHGVKEIDSVVNQRDPPLGILRRRQRRQPAEGDGRPHADAHPARGLRVMTDHG